MRKWKQTIDLKELWDNEKGKEAKDIDFKGVGKSIAACIRVSAPYNDFEELEKIAKIFERVKKMRSFDNAMNILWDFGDENSIWIATF